MAFLQDAEKARIAEAIRQAERHTCGELVTVVARQADDYPFLPTLWAALIALLLPGLALVAGFEGTPLDTYAAQVGVFLLLAALFRLPALKMRLIPPSVKRERAQRLAREQFFLQNLHHTSGRTGLLLFVSVAEHYVEIIADKGINDVVPPGTWEAVVGEFVGRVKARQVAEGFLAAIEACGALLRAHFPQQPEDRDELPNHLIEI